MENSKYTVCPICGKQLKIITKTHYGIHGYNSKEDFLKDFPNAKLISDEYKIINREIHGGFFAEYNKTDIQRKRSSENAKKRNSNSEFQREMQSRRKYTPEERNKTSQSLKCAYAEGRKVFVPNYGKRHEFVLKNGTVLFLRSYLESKYVKFFELNDLDFQYESLRIPYISKNKKHEYLPDFYLPKYNLLIEVKPESRQFDEINQTKKNASVALGYNYLFAGYNEIKNYQQFLEMIYALDAK